MIETYRARPNDDNHDDDDNNNRIERDRERVRKIVLPKNVVKI